MRKRLPLIAALSLTMIALPMGAHAEPTALDRAAAESLFEDGMKLVAAQDYAAACPKLAESQRIDPAMAKKFRLAECYEAIGRTASAWANFVDVADDAAFAGKPDREKVARARAAKLEAVLSRATIVVTTPDLAGLEVHRGDLVVGKAQWGSATPVDPATYAITASAPGKITWTGSMTVSENGGSATLTVPALEDVPKEPEKPKPEVVPTPEMNEIAKQVHTDAENLKRDRARGVRDTGITLTVVGGVAVILGVVLGVIAKGSYDSAASAHCQGSICDQKGLTDTDVARTTATGATTIFFIGVGATAVGALVWILAPSTRTPPATKPATSLRGLLQGSF